MVRSLAVLNGHPECLKRRLAAVDPPRTPLGELTSALPQIL